MLREPLDIPRKCKGCKFSPKKVGSKRKCEYALEGCEKEVI